MKRRLLSTFLALVMAMSLLPMSAFAAGGTEPVAQVGEGESAVQYETLAKAIAAANDIVGGATVTLLTDAEVAEAILVTGNVTIDGAGKTITWASGYTGTLFNVDTGGSLTTEDLTIDGENAFTFYNDTTTVENGQNWYTRFVDVDEEDKAVNADVIVNTGNLTLGKDTVIQNVTIASDSGNGKTANTETGGFYLMYNDDLAVIKSNGGTVNLDKASITGNAGMILNAVNAVTTMTGTTIDGNMGAGNKGGIVIANDGTMDITDTSISGNKAMARSATILGVINGAEVEIDGNTKIDNNKHIGVGSNTAGAIVVLEGASQFVMNDGSISNNVGGRAGAIASRWVGGSYGQHEDTSIVLNAGKIEDNTASNDSWNGATVFLRSPATIGEGMKIDGSIAVNAAPGQLDITGGTFNGSLTVADGLIAEITGGTFNYDPSKWVPQDYIVIDNKDGTWTVEPDYVIWVKKQLLAGNSVTLDRDIVVDATYMDSISASTNGNGKYPNYGIFNVVGDNDVTFDLNGFTITYNGHADFACGEDDKFTGNSCTVAHGLFFANADADLTIIDSKGTGAVNVNGVASGVYSASPNTTITVKGGTWTNKACAECGNTNLFLYASHGGELYIEGGKFEQALDSDGNSYLIVEHGGEYANSEIDFSKTKIEISGGTFVGMNPEKAHFFQQTADNKLVMSENTNSVAEGYKAVKNADDSWTVVKRPYIAQVGETKYYDLQTALNACTNGETVKLIADVTYGEDDVVYAHGGATGFGNYDQYNPSIVYIGGTKGATEAENQPSSVNAVLDLNGHTITNNADAFLFLIMDNAKVTFKNSQEKGGIDGKTNYPVIWSTGAETLVTIENGKYTTASANGLLHASHSGDLVIKGGDFSTTANDASLLVVRNDQKFNNPNYFLVGQATVSVTGGTFHGFNPEKMMDDNTTPFTEFNAVAEGYKAFEVQSNTWVVMPADATVTVTFNSNGGTPVESQTVGFNTTVTEPTTYNSGYRFLGWYLDGTTSPYDFSTPVTGDMTLIAQWQKKPSKPVNPPADDDEDINDNPPALGNCDGGENCPSAPYVDVDQSLWYHDGIDYVLVKELMNGVGDNLFAPNGTTNRAMIVTILHRLEGTPEAAPSSFVDVPADQWYTDAVGWAAANGIVTGYDADTFGPLDPITREQMAAILYRYADYKGYDVSAGEDTNILSYVDAESVSEYAVTPMQWAVGEGLIAGMENNNLVPGGTALRSQVATILMRFCENIAK